MSQPAIYVASLAALEKMKMTPEGVAMIDAVDVCAGLSLGEYSALTFAGALTFEDGLKLVKLRGESMQAAADATPSGMASVIGLDADKTKAGGYLRTGARTTHGASTPCRVNAHVDAHDLFTRSRCRPIPRPLYGHSPTLALEVLFATIRPFDVG